MKTIQVLKKFVLTLRNGTERVFEAGVHEVEAHLAEHWFVKAHTTAEADVKDVAAKADEVKADLEADAKKVEAAVTDAAADLAKKTGKK